MDDHQYGHSAQVLFYPTYRIRRVMTTRLYFENAYIDTFEATIEGIEDDSVYLDQTAFYPTGGGQPHDTGLLRGEDGTSAEIVDVTGRDRIGHELSEGVEAFDVGESIVGILDWERRYALMQYHTAQHLLSAVLLAEFDAPTTGNQLYPDRARIDCGYERFDEGEIARIEERVNSLRIADHDISISMYERDTAEAELDTKRTRLDLLPSSVTEVRIVTIGDEDDPVDRTACAGTHVRSTDEIPPFEVTGRETKGSDEERLSFHLPDAGQPR